MIGGYHCPACGLTMSVCNHKEEPVARERNSRPKRWAQATSDALASLDILEGLQESYEAPEEDDEDITTVAVDGDLINVRQALEELVSLQEEYEEWKDNLPEGLESSPLGEKLEAIASMDLHGALDILGDDDLTVMDLSYVRDVVEEADAADLPLGFGRD